MAQKRMFSLHVVDTDKFMDMSPSAQALYFHLGMHGDDDGFVSSPRKIVRATGCNDDDMRLLVEKEFIIPFDSGVVLITDWKLNNTIKTDRYTPTIYRSEMSMVRVETTGRYFSGTRMEPKCVQNGSNMEPQNSIAIDKPSVDIDKGIKADKPPTHSRFIPPTVDEVRAYCMENGYNVDAERFVNYYATFEWTVGKNKIKDWKALVRNWAKSEKERPAGSTDHSREPDEDEKQAIERMMSGCAI